VHNQTKLGKIVPEAMPKSKGAKMCFFSVIQLIWPYGHLHYNEIKDLNQCLHTYTSENLKWVGTSVGRDENGQMDVRH